jgi:hypothetical protein
MPSLRIRALIALPLIAAVLFAPTASASSPPPINIGVAPSKLQLRLIPGHTVHTVIKVYNKGTGRSCSTSIRRTTRSTPSRR